MSALELVGDMSTPFQNGRRLLLKFIGQNKPELDRIEFKWSDQSESFFWQQGNQKNPMSWTKVPQALSLIFLDYLSAGKGIGPVYFSEITGGDLVGALGNAITDKYNKLHELLADRLPKQPPSSRVKQIFAGKNVHGKEEGERRICVQSDNLPTDCIDIYWQSSDKVTDVAILQDLARRIRVALEIPFSDPPKAPPVPAAMVEPSHPTPPIAVPLPVESKPVPPATTNVVLPESFLSSFEKLADAAAGFFKKKSEPRQRPTPPPTAPPPEPLKQSEPEPPKPAPASPPPEPEAPKPSPQPRVTIPKIDPAFFNIYNKEGLAWTDDMGLLDFGDEEGSEDDIWRLKDACEGVLILGAPGSGKTSSSGFALAQTFLRTGFGGLVLCAKTDEARRWQSLCARFGRAEDCIVINRQGLYCLNALAYETQWPGERIGLTDDLISFFRVLIAIVSKRTGGHPNEDFWVNATNQLMQSLFDVFLLSGEPLVIDSLTRFVTLAPEKPTSNWRNIEFFGDIISRAEKRAASDEDKRILRECVDYWTAVYPGIASATRSGITLGFTAMANALSGRGIHDLISSTTNITPELILSGLIVILDLPIKECGQGGLLVQAAWKFLFQRAIERRADKGRNTARPVFLWEDEAHLFFSQHDIDFQPTARDCRAAHVIISQNLHNFYQLGHNPHAVQGVFATMNTQIFHANGDLETNKWASDKIGTELTTLVNVSVSPVRKQVFWDQFKPHESTANTSINQHREKIFQPEQFSMLKKGGDGTCQAVLLWVSHQFRQNQNRPFKYTVFEQDSGV